MDYSETPVVRAELQRELDHLRELLKEKSVALDLQRVEYHRRLLELNNAHERTEKAAQATVPRETYDTFMANHSHWKEDIKTQVDRAVGAAAANARIFYIITTLMSLMFGALALWLKSK